jgi:hypothetical protein
VSGGVPLAASPDTSSLSPESALVAVIASRQAALDAVRAGKGHAAVAATAPPPASPVALSGLDFLRPAIASPALVAMTDLEVIDGLGGEDIARRIMVAAGNPAPLVRMAGPGSVAMGREVASDFARLYTLRWRARSRAARRPVPPFSSPLLRPISTTQARVFG